MAVGDVARPLASMTCNHKLQCIHEKSGPVEACLKNFGNGLIRTKVSTMGRSVMMVQNTMDLIFRQTSLIDTIFYTACRVMAPPAYNTQHRQRISSFDDWKNLVATLHTPCNSLDQHTTEWPYEMQEVVDHSKMNR